MVVGDGMSDGCTEGLLEKGTMDNWLDCLYVGIKVT